jgi:tetratricopeptide (TPR) repeat protein
MSKQVQKSAFKKAFKDKRILICDPYHLANSLIKKTLTFYGADFPNIHTTQTIEDSLNTIESINPDYIFSFHRDKKSDNCESLFLRHLELRNDRSEASFFLMVKEDNALYASAFKRKYSLNGLSFEPFTVESVEKSILTMLKRNVPANEYLECMNKGQTLYNGGFYKDAEEYFLKAEVFASFDPADAIFYQGVAQAKLKNEKDALHSWNRALEYCSHHAKSLRELFLYHHKKKEFERAYELQSILIHNHPLDPMLIPHFILVSVRMKKYGEIYNLALHFQKLNYKVKETERSIAAGLIMSGRFFIANKEIDLGRKILLKAAELAETNFDMFQNISTGLLDGNFFVDAYEIIAQKVEENPSNVDFRILEIDLLYKANELSSTLERGMKLINEEVYHSNLYQNVIMASIKIGRNKKTILDLLDRACSLFPEDLDNYLRIKDHYFPS